jgi:hypothetical protein
MLSKDNKKADNEELPKLFSNIFIFAYKLIRGEINFKNELNFFENLLEKLIIEDNAS